MNLVSPCFSMGSRRDSKNFVNLECCPNHCALRGKKHIEGEAENTFGPGSFELLPLRGTIIKGESGWESFCIIALECHPILECHQSSTQESLFPNGFRLSGTFFEWNSGTRIRPSRSCSAEYIISRRADSNQTIIVYIGSTFDSNLLRISKKHRGCTDQLPVSIVHHQVDNITESCPLVQK